MRLYVKNLVTGGTATLSQQEKSNSADEKRSRVNFTGFFYTVAR
jgi:hypothetical protein